EYSAQNEGGDLRIQFPIRWEDNGSDVKVWMDLSGKAPKSPPVMPYESRRPARAKRSTFFGAVFDAAQFVPGKTYDLNVKVEYVADGRTRIATDRLNVVVPETGASRRADRFGKERTETLQERALEMQKQMQK